MRIHSSLLLLSTALGLVLSTGCTSDKTEPPPAPKKAPPPPPFRLTGSADQLPLNQEMVAFGGLNLIDEVTQSLLNESKKILTFPINLRTFWFDNFIKNELLFNPTFILPRRPFRFVQFLDDQGQIQSVRLVGVKKIDELKIIITS